MRNEALPGVPLSVGVCDVRPGHTILPDGKSRRGLLLSSQGQTF